MKKSFAIVLGFILCLCLSACSGQETQQQTSSQLNSSQEQSDTGVDDAGSSDKVMTEKAMLLFLWKRRKNLWDEN